MGAVAQKAPQISISATLDITELWRFVFKNRSGARYFYGFSRYQNGNSVHKLVINAFLHPKQSSVTLSVPCCIIAIKP